MCLKKVINFLWFCQLPHALSLSRSFLLSLFHKHTHTHTQAICNNRLDPKYTISCSGTQTEQKNESLQNNSIFPTRGPAENEPKRREGQQKFLKASRISGKMHNIEMRWEAEATGAFIWLFTETFPACCIPTSPGNISAFMYTSNCGEARSKAPTANPNGHGEFPHC